jgi:protein TonB
VMIDLAPIPAAPAPAAPPVPIPAPPTPPHQELQPPPPVPVPVPVPVPLPPRRPVEHRPVHHPVTPPKPAPPAPVATASTIVPTPAPVPAAPAPAAHASPPVPANAGLPSFESLLAAHLDRYKRYPPAAQTHGEQGVAYLRFTMDRQGRVLAYRLERSSGHAALDAEVLALIRRAEPLPPIPASVTASPLEVVVPVRFSLR